MAATPQEEATAPHDRLVALILTLFVIYILGWVFVTCLGSALASFVAGAGILVLAWFVSPPRGAEALRWGVAGFGGLMVAAGLFSTILG